MTQSQTTLRHRSAMLSVSAAADGVSGPPTRWWASIMACWPIPFLAPGTGSLTPRSSPMEPTIRIAATPRSAVPVLNRMLMPDA
jgi:hypothetical protein